MRVALPVTALLALTACPSPLAPLKHKGAFDTAIGRFEVDYARKDKDARVMVQKAVVAASPKLRRWGALRDPVRIRLMPDHASLEDAVNQHGFGWLRAWARFDEVFLQSPRTWSALGARQPDVDELMLHELTHSLMYQESSNRTGWTRKDIPVWFREGMASVTANQEYKWLSLDDLARFLDQNPGVDPLAPSDELYRDDQQTVYTSAHHAFAFFLRRYGDDAVRALMHGMRDGATFGEAFAEVLGFPPEAFARDFVRYVRTRAYRGGRLIRSPWRGPPPPEPEAEEPLEIGPAPVHEVAPCHLP